MRNHEDSVVNPIYEWLDEDIWDYVRQEHIKVNPLYARGYTRVGCIGCPLAGYKEKVKEFTDYPKYKQMYINAFEKMIKARAAKNKENSWTTGQEVFDWWIEENKYNVKGQLSLFEGQV